MCQLDRDAGQKHVDHSVDQASIHPLLVHGDLFDRAALIMGGDAALSLVEQALSMAVTAISRTSLVAQFEELAAAFEDELAPEDYPTGATHPAQRRGEGSRHQPALVGVGAATDDGVGAGWNDLDEVTLAFLSDY